MKTSHIKILKQKKQERVDSKQLRIIKKALSQNLKFSCKILKLKSFNQHQHLNLKNLLNLL